MSRVACQPAADSARLRPMIAKLRTLGLLVSLCLLLTSSWALALGGSGADKPEAESIRKLKLSNVEENEKAYGWVRISADQLALGANFLQPDAVYSVYFVNGGEKQMLGEEPGHSSEVGEFKFAMRLTEPLGAQWAKVVIYQHPDGNPENKANLKPVMEASLR